MVWKNQFLSHSSIVRYHSKDIIRFFRESILRRKLIPNVPLFCETRWSEKYKSVRLFSKYFEEIKTVLDSLALDQNVNTATRNRAFQLSCATSNIGFLVSLELISFYSAIMEPVVTKLQAVSVNLHKVHSYVKNDLINVLKNHRDSSSNNFQQIYNNIKNVADKFNIDINIPRIANRQTHRANYSECTPYDYYRVSLYIPYLDSIINSLEARFSEHNETPFKLGAFIPSEMIQIDKKTFNLILEEVQNYFQIENLIPCGSAWYSYWENKSNKINSKEVENINISHLLKNECDFFPEVKKCLIIFLTIPPTTCTVERSFSTLRRVKTWTRNTMGENRLDGLCMLSCKRSSLSPEIIKNPMYIKINMPVVAEFDLQPGVLKWFNNTIRHSKVHPLGRQQEWYKGVFPEAKLKGDEPSLFSN